MAKQPFKDSTSRKELSLFLKQLSLDYLDNVFPNCMNLQQFRALTEDELEQSFHVENDKDREELMRAVNTSREDYSDDEDEVWILIYDFNTASHSLSVNISYTLY